MVMEWDESLERGLLEQFISVLWNDDKLYGTICTPASNSFCRNCRVFMIEKGRERVRNERIDEYITTGIKSSGKGSQHAFILRNLSKWVTRILNVCKDAEVLRLLKFKLPYLFYTNIQIQ